MVREVLRRWECGLATTLWQWLSRAMGVGRAAGRQIARRPPHLSKSRYLTGLQCERRLWLSWHDPERAVVAPPGSIFAVGHEVGQLAHDLFPGGVLVGGGPSEFDQAVKHTTTLVADASVPAIFEAAFVFNRVRVRADILQRLADGRWALHEVKSSTSLKPENVHDLTIQTYVIEGAGLEIDSANLVHVDTSYLRGPSGIEARGLFISVDATAEVRAGLADVRPRVEGMHNVLALLEAPTRQPSPHCFKPYDCEFWSRCTKAKPQDWIWHLPRLTADQFRSLEAEGVDSIRDIPSTFALSAPQRRVVDAWRKGGMVVQAGLAAVLPEYTACAYLDFETLSPALPLYAGTRPYQRLAAQWSLHLRREGELHHAEFLADMQSDPARGFAVTLLQASDFDGPVFVYSSFERSVLRELTAKLPDLAERITALDARLVDLLPTVRGFIDHPRFNGSNSIKAVAPVLAPDVTYGALEGVADGGAASEALYRLATKQLQAHETEASLRRALLDYCKLDTLALARVHEALERLAIESTGANQ